MKNCCRVFVLMSILSAMLIIGCAPAPRFTDKPSHTGVSGKHFKVGQTFTGLASWYGPDYHGKRTSCGEVYDMEAMTAAHCEFPFNTVIEVTHLGNGKSCQVRINDRGPFDGGRILDLSRAAAREIGMLNEGVVKVRIKIIKVGEG
jgi:rare lipoprotein A (peptidoglycan hydrolase)